MDAITANGVQSKPGNPLYQEALLIFTTSFTNEHLTILKSSHTDATMRRFAFALTPLWLYGSLSLPCISATENGVPRWSLEQTIQHALSNQPFLEIQEQELRRLEGSLIENTGAFDWRMSAQARHGFQRIPLSDTERDELQGDPELENVRDIRTNITEYRAGVGRLMRSGVSTELAVEFERQDQKTLQTQPPVSRSRIVLAVNIPLLRGLGSTATAAFEKAAQLEVEAGVESVHFTASQVVTETTVAYWNLLAAERAAALQEASVQRAADLLESIRKLADADEIPRSSVGQAQAYLSEQEVQFLQAKANAFVTRRELGLALGLETHQLRSVPLPMGEFPEPQPLGDILASLDAWLTHALQQRADLRQLTLLEQSSLALREQARTDLKPRVDLRLEADYAQVSERSNPSALLTPFRSRHSGPGIFAVLSMDLPVGNREAKGRFMQQQASHRQSELQLLNLERSISAEVANRLNSIASNVHEWENMLQAVAFYEQALKDESRKFQMGMGTVLDVVQTQERLTQAQLSRLDTERRYAENLARLRFELGDLLSRDGELIEFSLEKLLEPPSIPETNR